MTSLELKRLHPYYQIEVVSTRRVGGVPLIHVKTTDIYQGGLYAIERRAVLLFTGFLQYFLEHHPDMPFESRRNLSRHLSYLPSGMRAWRGYMPGGFATYHVHAPHIVRMANGVRLDPVTRAFFRHTYDAVGLRSRAYIMSWLIARHVSERPGEIRWLSLGGGSGKPVYDAIASMKTGDRRRTKLVVVDINPDILTFAKQVYVEQTYQPGGGVAYRQVDVTSVSSRDRLFADERPTVIDAMGLFEYLDDRTSSALLRAAYRQLPPGGIIVFTNMSPEHPQLAVHKRALGWPGVIQRTIHEVVDIMVRAGIPREEQTAYRAQDGVYNVYQVVKHD